MTNTFLIELSSWIIQDGNYPDFQRGQLAAFAVEFGAAFLTPCQPPDDHRPAAQPVENDLYQITGRVIHATPEWQCLDMGIRVYCNHASPGHLNEGEWVQGQTGLGVDPYFYFGHFAQQQGAPALIYDWWIDAIEVQTAPFVEVSPRVMARDESQSRWEPLDRTDAWNDQGGRAAYRLTCRLNDSPPRKWL
ncbi:MAG: hypothetical protein H7Z12_08830 [Rhodospirillaceae bacterium]|nr:hypothetical protein [Rhodospirillales bacterium]